MEPLLLIERALAQVVAGQNLQEASKFLRDQLKATDNVKLVYERLKSVTDPAVRQLICVLLRRALVKHWLLFDGHFQAAVKETMLHALATEPFPFVRRSLATIIAALAGVSDWPELLLAVSNMSLNEASAVREIGLFILSEMLDNERTYPSLKPHFASLGQLLVKSLADPAFEVKKNALLCIGHLVRNIPDELGDLRPMLPLLTDLVRNSEGDEQLIAFAFEIFSELLSFNDFIIPWTALGLEIACNTSLQLTARESASCFIETAIEDYPKLFSKNPQCIEALIKAVFQLAVECDDDPDESTPVDMAFRILDTIALSLPNKHVWSPSIALITALQAESDHRSKRAAMLAAGVLAEGCSELLKENLQSLLGMLIGGLHDPRESVAEGAAIAIGYCAEHLRPDIIDWHAEILPSLIAALATENKVVRRRVLFALDAFIEACDDELVPYLEALLKSVVGLVLHSNDKESIRTALGTLNTIIEAAEDRVDPYFQELVTLLIQLTTLELQSNSSLVATALHTLGQLCDKCSSNQFAPYLENTLNLALLFIQSTDLELRESGFAFFYLAIPKNAASISPFLEILVTQALITLDRQAAVAPQDSDDEGEEELSSNTFLDEKTAAMHTLGTIAVSFPAYLPQFADHLLQALEILVHDSNESFRLESVLTYSQLVTACTLNQGLTPLAQELWLRHCLPKYLEILKEDRSPRVVGRVLQNLHELLEQIGTPLLLPNGLEELVERLAVLIQGKAACQRDFEDEDEQDFQEELTSDLVTVLNSVWKACPASVAQLEILLLLLLEECQLNKPRKSRTLYLGCLADATLLLSGWKPAKLLALATASIDHKHASLSRNCCFLIGAVCSVSDLSAHYPQILQAIQPFFEVEPTTANTRGLQDNAVAAVARMMAATPGYTLWPKVLGPWFARVPLKEDTDEKPAVLKAVTVLADVLDLRPYVYKVLELCFDALLHSTSPQYPPATLLKAKQIAYSLRESAEFQALGGSLDQEEKALLSARLS